MGKKVTGDRPTRTITVRVPADLHADFVAVAAARGIDLSALINQVLADARPSLVRWLRDHLAGLAPLSAGSWTADEARQAIVWLSRFGRDHEELERTSAGLSQEEQARLWVCVSTILRQAVEIQRLQRRATQSEPEQAKGGDDESQAKGS
jgi:hypothetical protein